MTFALLLSRFIFFLPSILLILAFALAIRFISSRMTGGFKRSDINEDLVLRVAQDEGERKRFLKIGLAQYAWAFIWVPALEELIFRAPLLIFFGSFSRAAFYGLVVSSLVFGICHIVSPFGKAKEIEVRFVNLLKGPKAGQDKKESAFLFKLMRASMTGFAGYLFGYFAITRQSLYLPLALHFAWNFGLVALSILLILLSLLFLLFVEIFAGLKYWIHKEIFDYRRWQKKFRNDVKREAHLQARQSKDEARSSE